MQEVAARIRGLDADDVFGYSSPGIVNIKDRYLGLLRHLGTASVFVYFGFFECGINYAHLFREPIQAIIETSLRMPPDGLPNETVQSYCTQNLAASALQVLPCVTGPDAWVSAPTRGGRLVFAATRVTDVAPRVAVPEGGLVRGGYSEGNVVEDRFFVLSPEAYTVGVSFTLHGATQIANHITIQDISTRLLDKDGKEVKDGVYWVSKKTGELGLARDIARGDRARFNVFKLRTLLELAGVSSLEEPSFSDPGKSLRYSGVVLGMLVSCFMDRNGKVWRCDYHVVQHESAEKKSYIPEGVDARNGGRRVQERRGIEMSVEVTGDIGFFSVSKLLTAWVTSLGLLGLTTNLVEILMLYVMPHRKEYAKLKFDTSADFSDVRAASDAYEINVMSVVPRS